MASIPAYIDVPTCAIPVADPSIRKTAPTLERKRAPSFPPAAAPAPAPRKFSVPTASLSTNVSDMLLSSLLPPNLPKIQPNNKAGGPGRARELSSQREALSLPLVSNNFRRFVTKASDFYYISSMILAYNRSVRCFGYKIEWKKCYFGVNQSGRGHISSFGHSSVRRTTQSRQKLMTAFNPRLLLLLPSATLVLILTHIHEKTHPLPSLLGVTLSAASATQRVNTSPSLGASAFTATQGPDGETAVVPPKEAESGVDYYLNLQAIQNLMGQM